MKLTAIIFLVAGLLAAQSTPVFPARTATNGDLFVATNNFATTLLTGITSATATSATVASATGLTIPGMVTIDTEIFAVCRIAGNTLTFGKSSCPNADGRGYDGSVAVNHVAGRPVEARVVAGLHNQAAAEVIAVENSTPVVVSDLGPYATLAAANGAAASAGRTLAISTKWTSVPTQTLGDLAFVKGGMIQPASGAVVTVPCPTSVTPFQVFDTSVAGPGSIVFSRDCPSALDVRMFGASTAAADNSPALQSAYRACATTLGGCRISYPSGAFAHTTKFTLLPGVPVQLAGAGNGIYNGTATVAPTLVNYTGPAGWFNQNAGDKTDNVVVHDLGFNCSAPGCQFAQVGSTAEADTPANSRIAWSFYNLWIIGVSGSVAAPNPGMSLSHLVRCQMQNMTVLNFYQDMVLDRTNACYANSVFFQNYSVGPLISKQAGSGGPTVVGAEFVGVNLAFQGPNYGSGQYSVTFDQWAISCTGCLYEPTVLSAGWMHLTGNAFNFADINGLMSGTAPVNSFVWDAPAAIMYFGTNSNYVPTPPISSGPQPGATYGSPATMVGVTGQLYLACLHAGNNVCNALGSSPYNYGNATAITGPIRVDTTVSGDAVQMVKNGPGAVNDINALTFVLPSSDQAANTEVRIYALTEMAGPGLASAGLGINTGGTATGTSRTVYLGADGEIAFPRYIGATGHATGKAVLCIDLATGILYASSSGATCVN